MKRVFIVHGWGGSPEEGWRPWLKNELTKKGFVVTIPSMPDSENPRLEPWVNKLAKTIDAPDENCFLIGHSLGCITILKYLEGLEPYRKIGGAILVAGFAKDLNYKDYKGEISEFYKTKIDWEKIKKVCKKFIAIHSDNDPYVPLENADIFKEKLRAKVIIQHNMKHFSGDDGITKLPIALESLLKLAK